MTKVIRTERGWAGHFIGSIGTSYCQFRRNTLLELEETRIVVSTVGSYWYKDKLLPIGHERYFETMAFHAMFEDPYWDADLSREVGFDSNWSLDENASANDANDMHETVVEEISRRMVNGEFDSLEITDKDIATLEQLHDRLYEYGKCSETLHESYISLLSKLQKIKENENHKI